MRDLVADVVEHHDPPPLVAGPVQNEHETIPETQPGVVRIVQAPGPALAPFLVRLPQTNGVPAGFAHLRFQLSPGENEVGLLVEPLLTRDAIALLGFARRVVPFAQVFKKVVYLQERGGDGLQIPHCRARHSQPGVTASRSHSRSVCAACQSGASKFSAISTMR